MNSNEDTNSQFEEHTERIPLWARGKKLRHFRDASNVDMTIDYKSGTFKSDSTYVVTTYDSNGAEVNTTYKYGSFSDIKMNGRFVQQQIHTRNQYRKFISEMRDIESSFRKRVYPPISDKARSLAQKPDLNIYVGTRVGKTIDQHGNPISRNENGDIVRSGRFRNNNNRSGSNSSAKAKQPSAKADSENYVPEMVGTKTGLQLRELRSGKMVKRMDGTESQMTQSDVARRLNIPVTTVVAMEKGDSTVPLTPDLKKKLFFIYRTRVTFLD